MSCGAAFTSEDLYDRGVYPVARIPHLPAVWPRCPECFAMLIRLDSEKWVCEDAA